MEGQALKLCIEKGPRAGETLEFRPGCRVRVGRVVRGNNVAIKDAGISSKHLSIDFDHESGNWILQDLGSSNGTFLNEDSVSPDKSYFLSDGDVVKIGERTSISVELNSAVAESKLRRNPRARAASRRNVEGDSAVAGLTVSGVNESKLDGRVKGEVVDLDPDAEVENVGTSKEDVVSIRQRPQRPRGSKKVQENHLASEPVNEIASENRSKLENEVKKAPECRRTRAAARGRRKLDEQKEVGILENEIAAKETCVDSEKGIKAVEVVNSGEGSEDKENLLSKNLKEHGEESQVKRNESKRTRPGSRRKKKLDEESEMGVSVDVDILHTVEEGVNEGREDKENAEMSNLGEEDGNVNLQGTELNLGEGHTEVFDDRGNLVQEGSVNVCGVDGNSCEDGAMPTLAKMTLREWFDFMEVHLPKQIIKETETMINEMRAKAVRVREYVAEQKNNKCKEPVR